MRGKNMVDVKRSNRRAILHLLHAENDISRKQLAQRLNLTSAAITMIVNEMIAEGILSSGGEISGAGSVGRRELQVELRSDWYGAGMMFTNSEILLCAVDIDGRLKMEKHLPLPAEREPAEELLLATLAALQAELERAQIPPQRVVGLGVTLRGYVDPVRGISTNSLGLWEHPVPVRDLLQPHVPYFVTVDNNVRSFAGAQNFLDRADATDNALFIRNEYGIGGAILTNYEAYTGSHDRAGELGHIRVPGHSRLCRCGSLGCLETVASVSGMLASAAEVYGEASTPLLYRATHGRRSAITLEAMLAAAEQGDRRLELILQDAVQAFVTVVAASVKLIDVRKVILYGRVFDSDYYKSLLFRELRAVDGDDMLCSLIEVSAHNGRLDNTAAAIQAVRDYVERGGLPAEGL